ncbi:uncharacterized protein TNCV_4518891 [Trichonephila clavipes]|nr:uncharacterized protein TNCV_4518891 [Trichonephila clavipes]
MWLYYCKLRGANDFESVNQLIVADKMFEMLDSETATHIGVLKGKNGTNPGTWANNVIYFMLPREIYDEPERAKWNDSEKRSFNGSWVKQPFGEKKSQIIFLLGKTLIRGQVTEIKKIRLFHLRIR